MCSGETPISSKKRDLSLSSPESDPDPEIIQPSKKN